MKKNPSIHIQVEAVIHKKIKVMCIERGITIKEFMNDLIKKQILEV